MAQDDRPDRNSSGDALCECESAPTAPIVGSPERWILWVVWRLSERRLLLLLLLLSPAVLATCRHPLCVAALAAGHLGRQLCVFAVGPVRRPVGTRVARSGHGSRHQTGHGLGNGVDNILPQLAIFGRVLLLEPEPLVLVHVGTAQILDLLHDVEQDGLGALVALEREVAFPNIPPGDVGGSVNGEGDAVRHLLAPAVRVQPRVVPGLLAGVDVHPPLLVR